MNGVIKFANSYNFRKKIKFEKIKKMCKIKCNIHE